MSDRCAHRLEVGVQPDAKRCLDMIDVGLSNQTDGWRPRIEYRCQRFIVLHRAPGAVRHAESGNSRPFQRGRRLEECGVGGVGSRPTPFHVIHTEHVQGLGDSVLLLGREIYSLRLLSVPQRRVIDPDPLARRHHASSRINSGGSVPLNALASRHSDPSLPSTRSTPANRN